MPQGSDNKDSIPAAIVRNLSLRRILKNLRRFLICLKIQGAEAAFRKIAFRVALATHGEVWKYRADLPLNIDLKGQRRTIFPKMPLVSIIVPVYNPPVEYFKQMLLSVLKQSYKNLELVLLDTGNKKITQKLLSRYKNDSRVRHIIAENKGISLNTTAAFTVAKGELITLLDHDDFLSKNAIFELIFAYNKTGAELIYSDEIVVSADAKRLLQFHFKPDYSPHFLTCCNYITHLCAFTSGLLDRSGRYEGAEYEGAGDYDLILRLCEKANKVHHIPKVLYFWRGHKGSTAAGITAKPYAVKAGAMAVTAHLTRCGLTALVKPQQDRPGAYRVWYENVNGTVSVIIPNYEHKNDLEQCLNSLYENAGIDNFEVIIIENNSKDNEIFEFYYLAKKRYPRLSIITYEGNFNFSAICNLGVASATGEHILLLNNDIKITSSEFLRELLSYSVQPNIGAVGAKLLYPNKTVQHAGVFVGIGGSAGHSHKTHPQNSGGDMYRLCTVQDLLAVTGACLMVKKELYNLIGGLDEKAFAVALNDVDFCLKLHKNGFYNVMTPFATAIHYESISRGYDNIGANAVRFKAERDMFRERWANFFEDGDPFYNPHLTLQNESYGWK